MNMGHTRARKTDPVEAFLSLPDDEKERVWASFDREIPFEETRPLTPAETRLWQRAARKSKGRPKAAGTRVQATVNRTLLRRADAYARRHGLSRSQLIAQGIERLLSAPS